MNKMKNLLIVTTIFALYGCGGGDSASSPSYQNPYNSDGSRKDTYSSCQIIESSSPYADEREKDLKQCWSEYGYGYPTKAAAFTWCEGKIKTYMAQEYGFFSHDVKYLVSTEYCKL